MVLRVNAVRRLRLRRLFAERWVYRTLLVSAVVAFLISSYRAHQDVRFHIDEAYWIGEAAFFDLFFVQGDFDNPEWTGYWGSLNPPFVKYVYGAALRLAGVPIRDFNLRREFETNWKDREYLREQMPPLALRVGRITAWLFGFTAVLLTMRISRTLGSRYIGIIAVLLFSRHSSFLRHSIRAMSEPIVVLLICLLLLTCIVLFQRQARSWKSGETWVVAALMALTIGTLTLAKPSGPLAVVVLILVVLVHLAFACGKIRGSARELSRVLSCAAGGAALVAAIAITSFSVAVVFNPYLHSDPLARMMATLSLWNEHIASQKAMFPEASLDNVAEKVTFFFEYGFPIVRFSVFNINLLIAVTGLLILVWRGWLRAVRTGRISPELIVLVWGGTYTVAHVVWTPFSWARYVVVSHPFLILLQAVAFHFAARVLLRGRVPRTGP